MFSYMGMTWSIDNWICGYGIHVQYMWGERTPLYIAFSDIFIYFNAALKVFEFLEYKQFGIGPINSGFKKVLFPSGLWSSRIIAHCLLYVNWQSRCLYVVENQYRRELKCTCCNKTLSIGAALINNECIKILWWPPVNSLLLPHAGCFSFQL